jgi:hypothetical protein
MTRARPRQTDFYLIFQIKTGHERMKANLDTTGALFGLIAAMRLLKSLQNGPDWRR